MKKIVTIKGQINKLLLIVGISMAVILIVSFFMIISVNGQYSQSLLCANTAADFNKEFKNTLDLEMYNHVIQPRTPESVSTLPMSELDTAEEVLQRLAETTSLPDNRWRVKSMLDMCSNLRQYMVEIAETESYDERMNLLERNIRGETGLTILIEQYMHQYIGDEVRELARLSELINNQNIIITVIIAAAFALMCAILMIYSFRFTRRLTGSIGDLSAKAQKFGDGNLAGEPITTVYDEIRTLDMNLDKMADRIDVLMDKQKEDQRSLHQAELDLLQAQINPHFLYNTLDSIAILAESERSEDVVNMVTSLSTFFRNSLNSGLDIISLSAEIAQGTSYLEIQQIRYSDIMTYSIDIPEEYQDCMVPKLILQPIIENALYHGIKNRRGRGFIAITGERKDGMLLLKVKDNGAGMTPGQIELLQNGDYRLNGRGMGLRNVDRRIRLYCGEGYGLAFESEPGAGTTVTIRLPEGGIAI
ncbi:MAG: sensor histidine kinase [Parasporobacterium sp.]|nr:sensor histidine kinase [Parasporobacterium sp.]